MTSLQTLMMSSVTALAALVLVVSGWAQQRPTLARTIEHLQLDSERDHRSARDVTSTAQLTDRLGRAVIAATGSRSALLPQATDLRLIGRTAEHHVALLALAAFGGLIAPLAITALLHLAGVLQMGAGVPIVVALALVVCAPLVVHSQAVERARAVRTDIRHQLSAYLDVVTMLLAGNTGHEGALEQSAHAGDGMLFVELRRRMREVGTTGQSLVAALDLAGNDLGIAELQQVAATASLSAAEGAPVARTLAAKCSTLRSTLATEQETEARLRTSRLTSPLVGMALIFMALVIYPALNLT